MANERLRTALARDRWSLHAFADALSVDHKTVERWITKDRTPHRKTAIAAAALIKEDPAYLWPDFGKRVVTDETHGEVITVYTERSSVPNSLWLSLLRSATDSVDILVYAGQSEQVRTRGYEEGVGDGMAARINYALAWHHPILGCSNLSIAFHSTVLYNSILRFDDQMLVNPHIHSMPAFRAPVIHLRKIQDGPLFQTYVECFERIWADSRPLNTKDVR